MTGWLMLFIAALVGAAAMALLRFPRPLWAFGAAALALGAAGYAWQGSPAIPGSPVEGHASGRVIEPELVSLRQAFFGRFGPNASSFVASDGLRRAGATGSAVSVMLGAIRNDPGSQALWTGLGEALVDHDGGQISPAAKLAFDRAILLDPRNPGPWFFAGLAYVRAGDLDAARAHWANAYALTPESELKDEIAVRLALLDEFLTMRDQAR